MGKSHIRAKGVWGRQGNAPLQAPARPRVEVRKGQSGGWIEAADFATLLGLLTLTGLAWTVPQSRWPALCRGLGPLALPMLADEPARTIERIASVAAHEAFGQDPRGLLKRLSAEQVQSELQLLRSHRPGGWRPDLALDGRAAIDRALGLGKGAVLWVSYSVYGDLLAKMAFAGAGLPVDHLSRPAHGFSDTSFGRALLNPIKTKVERRFLRSRVVLDERDPGGVLRHLRDRLARNGLVSITVHRNARRPLAARFMNGRMTLAPGAPLLAYRSGAVLLPVFPFRDGADRFRVTVGEAIRVDRENDVEQALASAANDYAAQLEPYVRRYPEQWRGWIHL